MNKKTTYRADIDGLRALSVISVILYHFSVWPFTGGFVGVDIFFVISGYLITSIIAREMADGEFSFLQFYARRFKRILPALFAVVSISLGAGYLLLMPGDYEALGRQSVYAIFGISNFYFLQNTGYFDQAADLLPLLHTWSLAVEEQFYLVWPPLLLAIIRMSRNSRGILASSLLILIAGSLGWSIYTVATEPTVAFYMLHTRAWELALGAVLAFLPAIALRSASECLSILGLGLITYSVFGLTSQSTFPGLNALPPCLGAALLIWPKKDDSVVARILSLRPIVGVGLVSYSLYLWHWPVLVFFRHYALGKMPKPGEAIWLLVACLLLSVLSWRLIERPVRAWHLGRIAIVSTALIAACSVALAGIGVVYARGLPQRLSPSMLALSNYWIMWDWPCPQTIRPDGLTGTYCAFGTPWASAKHKAVLWGDSNAEHLAPLIEAAAAGKDISVLLMPGCSPAIGGEIQIDKPDQPSYNDGCRVLHSDALQLLESDTSIQTVILSSLWTHWAPLLYGETGERGTLKTGLALTAQGLSSVVRRLADPNRKIVIVAEVPIQPASMTPLCAAQVDHTLIRHPCEPNDYIVTKDSFVRRQGLTYETLAALRAEPSTTVLLPGLAMCATGTCTNVLNGEFIYRDPTHFRRNLRPETRRKLAKLVGLATIFKGL